MEHIVSAIVWHNMKRFLIVISLMAIFTPLKKSSAEVELSIKSGVSLATKDWSEKNLKTGFACGYVFEGERKNLYVGLAFEYALLNDRQAAYFIPEARMEFRIDNSPVCFYPKIGVGLGIIMSNYNSGRESPGEEALLFRAGLGIRYDFMKNFFVFSDLLTVNFTFQPVDTVDLDGSFGIQFNRKTNLAIVYDLMLGVGFKF